MQKTRETAEGTLGKPVAGFLILVTLQVFPVWGADIGTFSQRENLQRAIEQNRRETDNSYVPPNSPNTYRYRWYMDTPPKREVEEPQISFEEWQRQEIARAEANARYERELEARRAEEAQRALEIYNRKLANTVRKELEIATQRAALAAELERKDGAALAQLGRTSYPLLKRTRYYLDAAFRANPAEYSILTAIHDAINNPYPQTQNQWLRVVKLAELSSYSDYLPFRVYSCALMQRAATAIEAGQAQGERAGEFAGKRLTACLDSLPPGYRKAESLALLAKTPPHLQMGTREFWQESGEGLDHVALRQKLAALPPLGNPDHYLNPEE